MTFSPCPRCAGNGFITEPEWHYDGSYSYTGVTCPRCFGTGESGPVIIPKEEKK